MRTKPSDGNEWKRRGWKRENWNLKAVEEEAARSRILFPLKNIKERFFVLDPNAINCFSKINDRRGVISRL